MRALGRKNISDLLRVLPMPAADLLDEWFESDVVKGAIAANGVRDLTWGPKEAGTAYALLYNWALSDTGLLPLRGRRQGRHRSADPTPSQPPHDPSARRSERAP